MNRSCSDSSGFLNAKGVGHSVNETANEEFFLMFFIGLLEADLRTPSEGANKGIKLPNIQNGFRNLIEGDAVFPIIRVETLQNQNW